MKSWISGWSQPHFGHSLAQSAKTGTQCSHEKGDIKCYAEFNWFQNWDWFKYIISYSWSCQLNMHQKAANLSYDNDYRQWLYENLTFAYSEVTKFFVICWLSSWNIASKPRLKFTWWSKYSSIGMINFVSMNWFKNVLRRSSKKWKIWNVEGNTLSPRTGWPRPRYLCTSGCRALSSTTFTTMISVTSVIILDLIKVKLSRVPFYEWSTSFENTLHLCDPPNDWEKPIVWWRA